MGRSLSVWRQLSGDCESRLRPFQDDFPCWLSMWVWSFKRETQLFNVTVLQEVGFGLKPGFPAGDARAGGASSVFCGLSARGSRTTALSGGQNSGCYCLRADMIQRWLDEPTYELVPIGGEQVNDVIARLNRNWGRRSFGTMIWIL